MLADMAFIGEGGLIYSNYRIKQGKKSFTRHPSEFGYYDIKQDIPDPPPKKWARKTLSGGISRSRRKKIKAKLSGNLPISGKQKKSNKSKF